MLTFAKLSKDVLKIKEYFEKSTSHFCDLSIGVKFMWRDKFLIDYAFWNNTLVLKESCKDYQNAFYLPMGENIEGALLEIEKFSKENSLPLIFCCIENKDVPFISERYKKVKVFNDRNWSDYIYCAQDFACFSGKKNSGQRNHINKFKNTYPNFVYSRIEKSDRQMLFDFLDAFENGEDYSTANWSKTEEENRVREFIDCMFDLGQFGAKITVDNKVVAFSIGEKVGDTFIVHIEKGLKQYSGVYPTMANLFAKDFTSLFNIKYINREEDCGEMGLRISKLQYHPIEIKEKNIIEVLEY